MEFVSPQWLSRAQGPRVQTPLPSLLSQFSKPRLLNKCYLMLKTVICFASFIYLLQNTCQNVYCITFIVKIQKQNLKTLKIERALL